MYEATIFVLVIIMVILIATITIVIIITSITIISFYSKAEQTGWPVLGAAYLGFRLSQSDTTKQSDTGEQPDTA